MLDDLPAVLTVAEAAKVHRLGRNTLYEAIRRGDVFAVRVSGRILVPRRSLEDLLSTPRASAAEKGGERATVRLVTTAR